MSQLPKGFALRFARHASASSVGSPLVPTTRYYSQRTASVSPTSATEVAVKYPYHIPRNSRGALPVYTDIRNGGTRYLVLVTHVQGNANAFRDDLAATLFDADSPEAARLRAEVARQGTVVLRGGRWKHRVMDWLRQKGF